ALIRCIDRRGRADKRGDLVVDVQAGGNGRRLAVRGQRPGDLAFTEIGRDLDRKQSVLPAGQKMRRLPAIGTAGIDVVVRPDRNVELLLLVAVEVSEQKAEGSVGVAEPSLECAGDACP